MSTNRGRYRNQRSPLTDPSAEPAANYEVVIVGSGYGGAIAASRFARAGRRVAVLERGIEHPVGSFPETAWEACRQLQLRTLKRRIGSPLALFDVRLDNEVNVLVGCGVGGTSLINASVALRPSSGVLADDRWPAALRAPGTLDPYFARAESWLGSNPYPASSAPLPKLDALAIVAASLGSTMERAAINVTFAPGRNLAGVEQPGCDGCGNCVSGCNTGAKNTVTMNYLPDAVEHGAVILTGRRVDAVRRVGGRWEVLFETVGGGRRRFTSEHETVSADLVVLAAGTLGSTEILLRSRDLGLSLSNRLGQRFSGNGDVLGFGFAALPEIQGIGWSRDDARRARTARSRFRRPLRSGEAPAPVGPCITGVITVDDAPTPSAQGLVIEEGSIPGILDRLLPGFLLFAALIGSDASLLTKVRMVLRSWRRAADRTMTFLVMSDDDADGSLVLTDDRITVDWPSASGEAKVRRNNELLNAVAPAIGAEYVPVPLWTEVMGRELLTVHPLGGCVMADVAENGVVNDRGQVFRDVRGSDVHQGLVVLDGSVVPRPLDTNPSLTISALTERAVELLAADRGWTIDMAPAAGPIEPGAVQQRLLPGIRFTERMSGWFAFGADDFAEGVERGQAEASPLSFVVTIRVDELGGLEADPGAIQRFDGTVDAPALSPRPLIIDRGEFRLRTPVPERAEHWHMSYQMTLTADDGSTYDLAGHKNIATGPIWRGWRDTTTLFVTITEQASGSADPAATGPDPVVGRGILTISIPDLMRQLATIDATNTRWGRRTAVRWRFAKAFAGTFLPVYGGALDQSSRLAQAPDDGLRPLRLPSPEITWYSPSSGWHELTGGARAEAEMNATAHFVMSANSGGGLGSRLQSVGDDAELMLTRYQGGVKGPVLLAAGFSMRANSFAHPTTDTTLAEALFEAGYDVWLFDYRASIALPSSERDFTIDDIATLDWPRAVSEVRRRTGADTVDVIGHCVGSVSILMALLAGLEGVRSVVCSQFTVHPVTGWFNRVKNLLHVSEVLQAAGIRRVSPVVGRRLGDRILDLVAGILPVPKGERCQLPVCRWLNAIFGLTHTHSQLDDATHRSFIAAFGTGMVRPLGQLADMTRRGRAVDDHGRNVYLPNVDRLGLPILFIQGAKNTIFKPEGTARTLAWLREHHDPALFDLLYLDEYAHLDAMVGRNAAGDVYPRIVAHLDRHAGH